MTLPADLILMINPEQYNDRAFVPLPPKDAPDAHCPMNACLAKGWVKIGDLEAESRKDVAKFFKAPSDSAGALADHLWELSQPHKREGKPPKFIPYSGKPPVQKED